MSRDRAIRFVVHFVVDHGSWTPSEWRERARGQVPGYGKPSVENLKAHCLVVEKSTQAGGCNSHIGVTKILRAWIVDQNSGEQVAEYTRAA